MRVYDIIANKRDRKELTQEEINFFINNYTKGLIPDYQASALLMAIYLNGLNIIETSNLTMSKVNSGDTINLSDIAGVKLDKHSTGGVGDKTTLILASMIAATGGKVAKLSGRGLGYTGGTLDKLESIQGVNVTIGKERFKEILIKSGLVIAGQTENIVPADKKIYALRDVTATLESIPLIASSVMSKKIAIGTDVILLDVKYGKGAFMKTEKEAEKLARAMVDIGKVLNRKTAAAITYMDEPLGKNIGNSLEVKESLEVLNGKGPEDVRELCLDLGSKMLQMSNIELNIRKGKSILQQVLSSGQALFKFRELIINLNGDPKFIDDPNLLPISKLSYQLEAPQKGYICELDAGKVGIASLLTGAGREVKDDIIDYGAGIILNKKIGDYVSQGDILATLYSNDNKKLINAKEQLLTAYVIKQRKPHKKPLIYKIIE